MEHYTENAVNNQLSYCAEVKNELCENLPKSKCCRRALYGGMIIYKNYHVNDNIRLKKLEKEFADNDNFAVTSLNDLICCENCVRNFIKGVFISCGNISSPNSSHYQLEMTFPDELSSGFVCEKLAQFDLYALKTERNGRFILYFRDNEAITDFLNIINAQRASYEFVNQKIARKFGSNANRVANCDVANIARTVDASLEQCSAIEKIMRSDIYASLPENLKITAQLRLDNPDLTLGELAGIHNPPITKSGVSHRLAKLTKLAEQIN